MEAPKHYIEAKVLPLDGAAPSGGDVAYILSRIMWAVHMHIVEGHQIGITFPQLDPASSKEGEDKFFLGSRMRLFGTANSLSSLIIRQDFAGLVHGGALTIKGSGIQDVPAEHGWISFCRDRRTEQNTPAFVERSTQRLLNRSAEGKCKITQTEIKDRRLKLLSRKEGALPPYINVGSGSTRRKFRHFLSVQKASGFGDGSITTYGMCKPGTAMPSF
ncbi:type I-F CRISPR-associated endoribonuclease Cas6/Csy4 [Roseibium sp. RKSG952]|uniref:type I-F CRISPR-associated endoribonuclease Cas6/Csy4 n=1 Tax=Roseibium sp. RKSG952 TaxID=2529384 RepID=UPI0012BC3525|nr:type I-F CRISPR-associated endoribonuclease Cas6/Csy4 [Roseibium sp. RKSG952]MTH95508.1 type I-F CRISPR-associated endoribonuclease Cas6/Csy4 [Roseibium sp. RKSG952]